MHQWILRGVLLSLLAACAVGCGPNRGMRKMNVTVNTVGQLPLIDVDLIGVDEGEKAKWERLSMSEYWRAQSDKRHVAADFPKTLQVGAQQPTALLAKTDPLWEKWKSVKKAKYLFVVANLPGLHTDKNDQQLVLPLESYRWNSDDVTITISSSGMNYAPAPNPEKAPK